MRVVDVSSVAEVGSEGPSPDTLVSGGSPGAQSRVFEDSKVDGLLGEVEEPSGTWGVWVWGPGVKKDGFHLCA